MTDAGEPDPDGVRLTSFGDSEFLIQSGRIENLHVNVRPPAVVPYMLPAAPAHFADRSRESARLDELLAAPRPVGAPMMVLLTGLGGVGKTAAGVRWAHGVREKFPDGQLYADVGGTLTATDVARQLLVALRVEPGAVPAEYDDRIALYRSLTAAGRRLVFLDNVTASAQAIPLIPPSSNSALIVASQAERWGLLHEGAVSVPLGPLPDGDAVALLAAIVGPDRAAREPEALAEVAELCGRWPLALWITGAHLRSRPRRTAARLATELAAQGVFAVSNEPTVRGVFDAAYRDLPDECRQAYRWLSLIPGTDFGLGVATAVLDRSDTETERVLDDLIAASLLDARGDRYTLRGLSAGYARERSEEADDTGLRDALVRRMVEWYLITATFADHRDSPRRLRVADTAALLSGWDQPFGTGLDALNWLDTEKTNLVAALGAAAAREWYPLVWWLAEALWPLFLKREHHDDWIACCRLAVDATVRLGNRRAEARMRCLLGRGYREKERYQEADTEYAIALNVARAAGDRAIEASAVEFVGGLRFELGDFQAAAELYGQSLAMHEELADQRGVAIQTHHLGSAQCRAGRSAVAVTTLERALEEFVELGDEYNQGRVSISLGEAYRDSDRLDSAEAAASRAVELLRDHSPYQEAMALEVLADVADRAGEAEAATGYLRRALDIYQNTVSPRADQLRERLTGR